MKSEQAIRKRAAAGMLLFACSFSIYASNPEVVFPERPLVSRHGLASVIAVPGPLGETAWIYQAGFGVVPWSGSLKKFAVQAGDEGSVDLATTPEWDAGLMLSGSADNLPEPPPAQRRIYTSRAGADKALVTIDFAWAQLDGTQQAMLNTSPVTGKPDGLGEKRLAYLRGERSLEAGQPNGIFPVRPRILGAMINGNPAYAGAPALDTQGPGYARFREENKGRKTAIYVGANDGMLHAFDAETGRELFAYMPGVLLPSLNQLTHPEPRHRAYVDGGIVVAEARVAGQWKTVLAAAMGTGAQALVALDVTDPANFGAGAGVLWEFSDADDTDLGNVLGAPAIVKFAVKASDGSVEEKYFVVAASGLNNYKNDGKQRFNTDAAGALFLLALDKPPAAKWQLGLNYYKIRTPKAEPGLPNGLHAPALVGDASGVVRHAYAGDLQGNLWRFDFSGTAMLPKAQRGKAPLFTAKEASGLRQPITMQPKVVFAPGGGYVALFGTGKFIEEADTQAANFRTQSFYAIYDSDGTNSSVAGREQLAVRRLEPDAGNAYIVAGDNFSYGTGAHQRKGWYLDFPDSARTGERAVAAPMLADGRLYFNTLIPCVEPCIAGGRSYVLHALEGFSINGNATGNLSQVGMPIAPLRVMTASTSGERNAIGRRTVKKTGRTVEFGTGGARAEARPPSPEGPASKGEGSITVPAGRFSWREILNWQEMRDALGIR